MSKIKEIKKLENEIVVIKNEFKEYRLETLKNFNKEKLNRLNEYRAEHGKVPIEIHEEYKQKEQELKEEIEIIRQEMLQKVKEKEDEITSLDSRHYTRQDVRICTNKLKSLIGGKFFKNQTFYRKMARSGIKNQNKAWDKINSQIRTELKAGKLKAVDVEKRVDELIIEISPNHKILTEREACIATIQSYKEDILNNGKVAIEIPYQSSGVNDALLGGAFFGSWGSVLGAMTEGKIKWNRTELLILEDGINVKATGQVILYENIKKVILGEKGISSGIVTILTHSKENLVFKVGNQYVEAIKKLLEEYASKYQTEPENETKTKVKSRNEKVVDEANALMKYAELYKEGLLTRNEFETKKAEILGTNENTQKSEPNLSNESDGSRKLDLAKYCPNCGNEVEINSKFCSNCGASLND